MPNISRKRVCIIKDGTPYYTNKVSRKLRVGGFSRFGRKFSAIYYAPSNKNRKWRNYKTRMCLDRSDDKFWQFVFGKRRCVRCGAKTRKGTSCKRSVCQPPVDKCALHQPTMTLLNLSAGDKASLRISNDIEQFAIRRKLNKNRYGTTLRILRGIGNAVPSKIYVVEMKNKRNNIPVAFTVGHEEKMRRGLRLKIDFVISDPKKQTRLAGMQTLTHFVNRLKNKFDEIRVHAVHPMVSRKMQKLGETLHNFNVVPPLFGEHKYGEWVLRRA